MFLTLIKTLEPLVKPDPEQEIRGVAVPVFEATLTNLKVLFLTFPSSPLSSAQYAPEIETGEPRPGGGGTSSRQQIDAAIGRSPIVIA